MPLPGQARLPGVHDHQADRHRHRDIDKTDDQQPGALTQRQTRADERIENRKEDQRNGQRLEQLHDNHAELAQLRVRDPAQVRLLAEDHPKQTAEYHGDEHLSVQGHRQAVGCGIGRGHK